MIPELSIVTGTRNRPDSLRRFLKSISATASVPTEIIVADASDDPRPPLMYRECIDIKLGLIEHLFVLKESPRLGPNLGYNVAFRKATGRYVLWANDDCEMMPGWDRTAIDFMDEHREVGIGALYFSSDGSRTQFYVQTFQHLIFANIGIWRREVGEQVDWFEERKAFVPELGREQGIEFYGCDTAACLKVIDAGYAVCPIPNCRIIHHREQDAERSANNQKYVFSPEGNTAGKVIWWLYNDPAQANGRGGDYGYDRLREKAAKFKHLPNAIHCDLT